MSRVKNDPGFNYEMGCNTQPKKDRATNNSDNRHVIMAKKTEIAPSSDLIDIGPDKLCPIHKSKHSLNRCRGFRTKSIEERRKILKENKICFNCCESNKHIKRLCKEDVKCAECGSDRHPTALHILRPELGKTVSSSPATAHGGEERKPVMDSPPVAVTSKYTQICGGEFGGKSCAKNILVRVYPEGHPEKARRMYAILDDQSNRSLARTEFFTLFNISSLNIEYRLSSCAGYVKSAGRRAKGYVIESVDGSTQFALPTLIECNQIPSIRDEIPTPEVAANHPHLHNIAGHIPALDNQSDILLLIGRDLLEAHHVLDQRTGPRNSPYAQRLPLEWVVVGESCLGKVHKPDFVNVNKTYLLGNGRETIFKACHNEFQVRESLGEQDIDLGRSVFERTKNDDKPGMSIEDREFLNIMDGEFQLVPQGNWKAPLPFRSSRPRLPNNKPQAMKRAKTLDYSLRNNPVKKQHFLTFMQRVIDSEHAEIAPPLKDTEECWYLPIFGVYHPRKPDPIRELLCQIQ